MMLLCGVVFRHQTQSLRTKLANFNLCSRPYTSFSLKSTFCGIRKSVLEPLRTPIQIQIRNQFDFSKKEKSLPRSERWFRKPKLQQTSKERNQTTLLYMISLAVLTAGASYAAVPLYRIFCQSSGYGGTTQAGHDASKVETLEARKERLIKVIFTADTAATMRWNFRPQQGFVKVFPGETALAFYTAKNPTDKPIDGVSTYNVVPFEAGQYFNKIQCFCFEEQRLNPNEEVDMPVFFYIDPDFLDDPFLEKVDTINLSYTFFESKPGFVLPSVAR